MLELDSRRGVMRAVDAGSPQLLRLRGGRVTPIALEQQLPLGMFAETRYDVQEFTLEPGDRLFVVSDGVYAAGEPRAGAVRCPGDGARDAVDSAAAGDRGSWYGDARTACVPCRRGSP
ncbi:SpoIIE family protein phosphatase [Micromonospora sp. BRA006-A]|nr:SpoIIE family protein phosphatase [Micromonospora sp. BRA006-A]